MSYTTEEIKIQNLERQNLELKKQLGFNQPQYNLQDTQGSYEKMVKYNETLEKEAAQLYQQLIDQFSTYKQLTSVKLECSFKQKYLNLLKKSQRRR